MPGRRAVGRARVEDDGRAAAAPAVVVHRVSVNPDGRRGCRCGEGERCEDCEQQAHLLPEQRCARVRGALTAPHGELLVWATSWHEGAHAAGSPEAALAAVRARARLAPGEPLHHRPLGAWSERSARALELLELPFEHVIVSHGEPVHDRAAFERALELGPWNG